MPRNVAGAYSLPAGSTVTDAVDDILASQHNTPLQDIAADLNAARPISSGGTAATTVSGARANLLIVSLEVKDFPELALITPAVLAVGDYVRATRTNAVYQRVASGGTIDYTGIGGVQLNVINSNDIQAFGADGVGNESAIATQAVVAKGSLHFSTPASGSGEYTLDEYIDGPFDNKTVSADPGVTVNLLGLFSETFGLTTFVTKLRTYLTSSKSFYTIPPTPPQAYKTALAMPQVANQRVQRSINLATEVTPLQVVTGTDTFSAATGAVSGQRYTITTTGAGSWRGGYVALGPYQTVHGYIEAPEVGKNIGVLVRGTGVGGAGAYSVFYGDVDGGNYTLDRKPFGGALVSASIPWNQLGQGAANNNSPRSAVWSVSRIDAQRANVLINGQVIVQIDAIGDIYDVGFVMQGNAGTISIAGLTSERRTGMLLGKTGMDRVFIFGDSTASPEPGAWPQYIPELMDGIAGISVNSVPNFAQAGTFVSEMATALTAQAPFAGASYIVVSGGTNDIQDQTLLSSFEATVTAMCATVNGAGKKIVWLMPREFYGRAQTLAATGISGVGQDSVNYDKGAKYRAVIRRIVTNANGIVVELPSEIPYADPRYLTSRPEKPWMRDSLHPDTQAYQMIAMAVARAIVDDYCALPDSMSITLPASAFLNGATSGTLRLNMGKDGLVHVAGSINVTTIASYTQVVQLPRWALPVSDVTVGATDIRNTSAAAMWVSISTAGALLIVGAPAGTTLVGFTATYKAAV